MKFPTQFYEDYFINHEIRIPINQPGFNGKWEGFFRGSGGGFNPIKKYGRQIGSFPEVGVKK